MEIVQLTLINRAGNDVEQGLFQRRNTTHSPSSDCAEAWVWHVSAVRDSAGWRATVGSSAAASAATAHACARPLNGPSPSRVGVPAVAATAPAATMATAAMAGRHRARHLSTIARTGTATTSAPPATKMTAASGIRWPGPWPSRRGCGEPPSAFLCHYPAWGRSPPALSPGRMPPPSPGEWGRPVPQYWARHRSAVGLGWGRTSVSALTVSGSIAPPPRTYRGEGQDQQGDAEG